MREVPRRLRPTRDPQRQNVMSAPDYARYQHIGTSVFEAWETDGVRQAVDLYLYVPTGVVVADIEAHWREVAGDE